MAPSERWTGRTMVPQDHLVDDYYVWLASLSAIFAVSEAVFLRLGCMTCFNAKSVCGELLQVRGDWHGGVGDVPPLGLSRLHACC